MYAYYALFLTDDALHAALKAGRTSPNFWPHAAAVADANPPRRTKMRRG